MGNGGAHAACIAESMMQLRWEWRCLRAWGLIAVLVALLLPARLVCAADAPILRLIFAKQETYCSAVAIGPSAVLTAGHCLFDGEGRRIAGYLLQIQDAQEPFGKTTSQERYYAIEQVILHPKYRFDEQDTAARARHDIALLKVEKNLVGVTVADVQKAPISFSAPNIVDAVYLNKADLVYQECQALGRDRGAVVTSCSIPAGASGGALIRRDGDVAQLVGILSLRASWRDQAVAFGVDLARQLPALSEELTRMLAASAF